MRRPPRSEARKTIICSYQRACLTPARAILLCGQPTLRQKACIDARFSGVGGRSEQERPGFTWKEESYTVVMYLRFTTPRFRPANPWHGGKQDVAFRCCSSSIRDRPDGSRSRVSRGPRFRTPRALPVKPLVSCKSGWTQRNKTRESDREARPGHRLFLATGSADRDAAQKKTDQQTVRSGIKGKIADNAA
jgi:hypothetical protein